ncbi:MAG: hypothetical protein WBC83_01700 [Minisyncoccia bacterium]
MCANADRIILFLETRVERIENEVSKLRESIKAGVHDPRSLVGDTVLVMEGQLKQIKAYFADHKDEKNCENHTNQPRQ